MFLSRIYRIYPYEVMKKKNATRKNRYIPNVCTNNMTFNDCELAVLRQAVDTNDEIHGKNRGNDESIEDMINIVEKFINKKKS